MNMRTRVLILFGCLVAAAGVAARADRSEPIVPRQPLEALPMQLGEWTGVLQPPLSKDVLDVLRADDYLTRLYYVDRSAVGLYIGFWKSQKQGDTIHSPLNCLPGAGWQPASRSTISLAALGNQPINRYVIEKGLERQLVLYWYQSHGRIVASEYWSKFYLVKDAVQLNRTDGAIVRIIAPIEGSGPEAERRADEQAQRFAAALAPQLPALLPD